MENSEMKGRTIKLKSIKNNDVIMVRSKEAKNYALYLENEPQVISYHSMVKWDQELYSMIEPVYIRKAYFDKIWESDFVLYKENGEKAVREIIKEKDLDKLANIEKLELSRRYWKINQVTDWKVIVFKGDRSYVL